MPLNTAFAITMCICDAHSSLSLQHQHFITHHSTFILAQQFPFRGRSFFSPLPLPLEYVVLRGDEMFTPLHALNRHFLLLDTHLT